MLGKGHAMTEKKPAAAEHRPGGTGYVAIPPDQKPAEPPKAEPAPEPPSPWAPLIAAGVRVLETISVEVGRFAEVVTTEGGRLVHGAAAAGAKKVTNLVDDVLAPLEEGNAKPKKAKKPY